MPIVVFVNPGSRANRRDPDRARRFASILGEAGQVLSPASSEALAAEARRVAQAQPSIIGVHGGDGTLHWTVTALLRAFRERPLPPLALLPGGTMNVVASSLGIQAKPEDLLAQLVAGEKATDPPAVVVRRCLKVQDEYGFVFGTGLITNFLQEYYAAGDYGSSRAIWILLRSILSEATTGRYAKRIFRRFHGRVFVDGRFIPPPWAGPWTCQPCTRAAASRPAAPGAPWPRAWSSSRTNPKSYTPSTAISTGRAATWRSSWGPRFRSSGREAVEMQPEPAIPFTFS